MAHPAAEMVIGAVTVRAVDEAAAPRDALGERLVHRRRDAGGNALPGLSERGNLGGRPDIEDTPPVGGDDHADDFLYPRKIREDIVVRHESGPQMFEPYTSRQS